jgi:hypothetical protein
MEKRACTVSVLILIFFVLGTLSGCGNGSANNTGGIAVSITPSGPQNVDQNQPANFTAIVRGDAQNLGVNWSLSASTGCTGAACGTLTNMTSSSVTYNAPPMVTANVTATLTATSKSNNNAKSTVSITAVPPPAITTTSLPDGTNGASYGKGQLVETGGVTPFNWSVSVGSLPAGLTLSPGSGNITGRPSGPGPYPFTDSFTVQLKDSGNPPLTATMPFSITINGPPPLIISTTSLPGGVEGSAYNAGVSVSSGGVPPLTWSISAGSLPPGLTFNTQTALISGIPTTQGTFNFTVQVVDSAIPPQTATQPLSITVGPPATLVITTTSLPGGTTGSAYTAPVHATGGIQPFHWSVSLGNLPSGVMQDPSSGVLSGTPIAAGTSTFTVTVADSETVPMTASATFSIVIAAGTTNLGLLFGNNAFLFNGFDPSGSVVMVGQFFSDGNGHLTVGTVDVNRTSGVSLDQSFTGTYSIGSDGRGQLMFTIGSTTFSYNFALDSASDGQFVELDSTGTHGSGIIRKQLLSSFSAANFSGDYAFGFAGADSSGKRAALAGTIHADGSVNLSQGNLDVNDAGALQSNLQNITGSFGVAGNGRGTATIGIPATLDFVFYLVSDDQALFMSSDTLSSTTPRVSGEALRESDEPFGASSLNGNSITSVTGQNGNKASVLIGLFNASSPTATLTADQNDAGTVSSIPLQSGSYAVAMNGRVMVSGLGSRISILYLSATNQAFVLGSDTEASLGILEAQTDGPPFSNASFSGDFTAGTQATSDASADELSGTLSADGMGNSTGTLDELDSSGNQHTNLKFTGVSSIASSGRGTYVLTPASGPARNFIAYVVSQQSVRLLPSDTTVTHPELLFFDH